MNNRQFLYLSAKKIGLELNDEQLELFLVYLRELKFWNKKINLTSIDDDKEIIIKHFVDSLTVYKFIEPTSKVIDIGTGAGFPGIPLAIVLKSCRFTLVDSVDKKIAFIRHIVRLLSLQNVVCKSVRIEDPQNYIPRRSFHYVLSRAFGTIAETVRVSIPYLVTDGRIVMMKGVKGVEELESAKGYLFSKGISVESVDEFELPFSRYKRVLIVLKYCL